VGGCRGPLVAKKTLAPTRGKPSFYLGERRQDLGDNACPSGGGNRRWSSGGRRLREGREGSLGGSNGGGGIVGLTWVAPLGAASASVQMSGTGPFYAHAARIPGLGNRPFSCGGLGRAGKSARFGGYYAEGGGGNTKGGFSAKETTLVLHELGARLSLGGGREEFQGP